MSIKILPISDLPERRANNDGKRQYVSIERITSEMESVARYYTGGYSSLDHGNLTIHYSVDVDVNNMSDVVEITFNVTCSATGDGTASDRSVQNAVKERLNTIVNDARNRVANLDNTRNYNINAKVVG